MRDTTDNWHVKYNDKPIRKFGIESKGGIIVLRSNFVKSSDQVTVNYFRDAPCGTCLTAIIIEDAAHRKIQIAESKGTFTPISFRPYALVNDKTKDYKVFFCETGQKDKILLFALKFK
ncbi:hypothetical protein LLH06_12660 [Mucilaginibacter daejeonensis]|uniref:hypothetical protein n=1 Tax=Mucilaginibacter daejeonensis TaxID=398049 RepID=UPI001D17D2DA|nr:hypothetical protein [Mucilaginibacter daejeonensis]UEG51815.1 hypothetical protein LLH06_12660 [Mucilaginibacter daejeonensis]